MIQFTRAIGWEVSLASFRMLEEVLLVIGGKTRKSACDKSSGQSLLFSIAGSTIVESVASRSFYCLPTIADLFGNDPSQQPCSSRHADAALDPPKHK